MDRSEFLRRRLCLFNMLPDKSIAIVASGNMVSRNSDSEYPFRVNSDFWYLTGFDEPESILVIEKNNNQQTTHIFLRERNVSEEIWNGRRLGIDKATKELEIDKAHNINCFESTLTKMVKDKKHVFSLYGQKDTLGAVLNKIVFVFARRKPHLIEQWHDLSFILHRQRMKKSSEELSIMRHAAMISSFAHVQMMRGAKPGRYEFQLAAIMEYESMNQGALYQAYQPIVATGDNACILHYTENNSELKNNDLVLIDAGCEYQYYASDITRTFPVNGCFSDWQKDLYQIVLNSQKASIDACRVGVKYEEVHRTALNIICEGLIDCGLFKQPLEQIIEQKLYSKYFMHGTSHWLGLDVHDAGYYEEDGKSQTLDEGMVLTVEPGIYIAVDDEQAPEDWRGTGIRIEDDILVTKNNPEVLTIAAPKEIEDISAIIGQESGRRT